MICEVFAMIEAIAEAGSAVNVLLTLLADPKQASKQLAELTKAADAVTKARAKLAAEQEAFDVKQAAALAELADCEAAVRKRELAVHAREGLVKHGATGSLRITSLTTWLRGVAGDRCAKAITDQMFRADFVVGLEKIASKMMNGGIGSSFTQVGREPTDARGNRVSEEAWATMSHGERLDYARGFDQRQFNRS
jgi:hypothetical protein